MDEGDDVWSGRVSATYMHNNGVHEYTVNGKGAEVRVIYTEKRAAAALASRLPDIMVWLQGAIQDGTATRTEVDGFWDGDEILELS